MSVENLQRGLGDLRQAFEDRRDRKDKKRKEEEAAQENARQRAASIALADKLSQTAEGQTAVGQFLATGIGNQMISPEKAIGVLEGQTGMKLFYQLQARSLTEQDPVQRKQLRALVNRLSADYMRLNSFEAYDKSKQQTIGILEAKKQFGVLKPPRGGGGGGKGQGSGADGAGEDEAAPTNLQVSFDDLPGKIQEFVSNDDFYSTYAVRDRTKGFLTVPSDQEDLASLQERSANFFNDYLRQHPILGQKGMEVPRAQISQKFVSRLATQGLNGFTGVGSTGDKMFSQNLAEFVPMSEDKAVNIATQNQGVVTRKKKGDIKSVVVPTTQTPLFKKKNANQNNNVNVGNLNADDNYYLGN